MKLRSHWDSTAALWEHGDETVAWHVLLTGQLDFLATWLEPILDKPFLWRVPNDTLHITLKTAASGEPAELEVDAASRCATLAPIDALVGPVRVVEEGVVASVEPAAELQALHDALPGPGGDPFWPHVSFAYANEAAEMDEIEVVASDAVLISSVQLVRLSRRERAYAWEVLAEVPLGGAA